MIHTFCLRKHPLTWQSVNLHRVSRKIKQIFSISDNGRNVTLIWKRASENGKVEGKRNNKEKKITKELSQWISDGVFFQNKGKGRPESFLSAIPKEIDSNEKILQHF